MRNCNKKLWISLLSASLIFSQVGVLSVEAVEKEVEYWGFEASSTLYAEGYDYSPWNVSDRNFSTAWVEGVSGDGVGETITIYVPEGTIITRGTIFPGYLKSEDLFYKNGAPCKIRISSGSKSVELNAGSVNSFADASSGYQFKLGDGLVVKDGAVTVTIEGVRTGTKYTDTCITELVFYTDDELTSDASGNVVRKGNTELAVEEEVLDHPAAGLDDAAFMGMAHLAQVLYEDYMGYGVLENAEISAEEFKEENKAMGLYWYQYNSGDERIRYEGEYNVAYLEDLRKIYSELYGDVTGEEMMLFLSEYCVSRDGNAIYMNGTGDFGAVGDYYFGEVDNVLGADGLLTISGPIMVYSEGNYVPECRYDVVYEENNMGWFGKYSFSSVNVY